MATLEVHDGKGHVRHVKISPEQQVLFGSSEKCEIVLSGAGVLPFHGRLRWKASRYKVDASPDAQYLEINGHRMTSSSLRQGDEIAVGPCRIFMLHADEDLPPDDATRIHPMPTAASAPPASRRRSRERLDRIRDLEMALPSGETTAIRPPDERRVGGRQAADPEETPARPARSWSLSRFSFSSRIAPGQEKILTSPVVVGLVIALGVLVVLGVSLHGIISHTVATRLHSRAVEDYDAGDYRNAVRRFDDYLATGRGDDKTVSKARVLRAMANIRQYTSTTGASWTSALDAEREMFRTMSKEPAYRDSSTDLAELVLKTGESLSDRARLTADAKVLAEAESTVPFFHEVAGKGAVALLSRSRLPGKLAEARAAVRKQTLRTKAFTAMDAALADRSSAWVYEARDSLIRQYAELAEDRELVARLTKANDLVRAAVKFDGSRRPAETEEAAEPYGPPTSLVLRSSAAAKPPSPKSIVLALAEGFAYGLDGATGAPLWQVPAGLSSPFPPVAVPGGSSAVIFDARRDELVRIDVRTGAPGWRQSVGEAVNDAPLVLGNQVIQVTPSGKVLLIDLGSGELQGTWNLGVPLSRSPAADESGQFLYVPADKDCLFVLTRDPPECAAVVYIGHGPGSIPCPPARLGRFLIVPENHALTEGRWRVFVLEEDSAQVRPIQRVAIPGWTWSTPASAGSVVWASGDRGGLMAFAAGSSESRDPFRLIAKVNPESAATGPVFAVAKTEADLWLSSGRSGKYNLDVDKGSITTGWSLGDVGPAVAPVQVAGNLAVFTHASPEYGGIALMGIDPETGKLRWQTVLGTPWIVGLSAARDGEGLMTFGVEGQDVAVSRSVLAAGGFVEVPLPKRGGPRLPRGRIRRLDGEGLTVLVPESKDRYLLVRADSAEFRRIELPVAPGATPMLWGGGILLPGDDGRVYLIDPATGESRAEPLVPAFDRDHPTHWRSPVRLNANAVALADHGGRVRRLTLVKDPRPRLVASADINLGKDVIADPATTGEAVVLVTADDRVHSRAARDLTPVGVCSLDAPLATAPVSGPSRAFVFDRNGGVISFDANGQRLWSTTLGGGAASGAPVTRDDTIWFFTRDGSLENRSATDGALVGRIAVGALPAGGLLSLGTDLVVPVARGTVRLLNPKDPASEKATSQ